MDLGASARIAGWRARCLARLLGVEAQRHAGCPGDVGELPQGPAGLGRTGVGEDGDEPLVVGARSRGSTSSASSSIDARVPGAARPASARQTNVSRLPFGPGSPEEWKPSTADAERRRGLADEDQGFAAVARVAHDAALADPAAAELELRLDHRQGVEAGRPRSEHGGEDLAQRDERDVDHDQVGSVRAGSPARCGGRCVRSITVTRGSVRSDQASSP